MNFIDDYEQKKEELKEEEFEVIENNKVYPPEVGSISNVLPTSLSTYVTYNNVISVVKVGLQITNHIANYQRTGSIGCIRCGYSSHTVINCYAKKDRYGNIL